MNQQPHPRSPFGHRTDRAMALIAVLSTAMAGVLTLVLGPESAAAGHSSPPTLAAAPPAPSPPSTAPAEAARPRSGPRPTRPRAARPQPVRADAVHGHDQTRGHPSRRRGLAAGHSAITPVHAAQLVETVGPTLVNITVRLRDGSTVAGTGIVLRSDGLVLTNDHVIAGAVAIRGLSLANQRSYRATVLAADDVHDVAVLKLRGAGNLPVGPFGDSRRLRVGDQVSSLGNAWRLGGLPAIGYGPVTRLGARIASTTQPPITGHDDEVRAARCDRDEDLCEDTGGDESEGQAGSGRPLTGLIEARNRVQPGQSGGPMVDRKGRIIGLNVAHSGPSGHPTGSGFAIPINRALDLATSMLEER